VEGLENLRSDGVLFLFRMRNNLAHGVLKQFRHTSATWLLSPGCSGPIKEIRKEIRTEKKSGQTKIKKSGRNQDRRK
jgi:hypothetical protein